ncbi:MAG TPA: hypothetical protein VKH42_02955, partial [Vicinamibacterales bacterium]|nr:hypothetical protein [Vicinamibacterales bacterium]
MPSFLFLLAADQDVLARLERRAEPGLALGRQLEDSAEWLARTLAAWLILPQPAPPATTIELTDDAVAMPAQIPAGLTAFAVANNGRAAH